MMDKDGDYMEREQSSSGGPEEEQYDGLTEREVVYKLLAAHAMVDRAFYEALRKDPVGAAAELHIALNDEDVEYITNVVNWDALDEHAEPVREALQAERAMRSLW